MNLVQNFRQHFRTSTTAHIFRFVSTLPHHHQTHEVWAIPSKQGTFQTHKWMKKIHFRCMKNKATNFWTEWPVSKLSVPLIPQQIYTSYLFGYLWVLFIQLAYIFHQYALYKISYSFMCINTYIALSIQVASLRTTLLIYYCSN